MEAQNSTVEPNNGQVGAGGFVRYSELGVFYWEVHYYKVTLPQIYLGRDNNYSNNESTADADASVEVPKLYIT